MVISKYSAKRGSGFHNRWRHEAEGVRTAVVYNSSHRTICLFKSWMCLTLIKYKMQEEEKEQEEEEKEKAAEPCCLL